AHLFCLLMGQLKLSLGRISNSEELADRLLLCAWELRNFQRKRAGLLRIREETFRARGRFGRFPKGYPHGVVWGVLDVWRQLDYVLEVTGLKHIWESIQANYPTEMEAIGRPEAPNPKISIRDFFRKAEIVHPERILNLNYGRELLVELLTDFDAEGFMAEIDCELSITSQPRQS